MKKRMMSFFWALWALAHAAALAGVIRGGWILGIAGDAWGLLCCLDAGLFALSALMGAKRAAWFSGAMGGVFAAAFFAFPYQPWESKAPPSEFSAQGKSVYFSLLQGNIEAKGYSRSWDYDVVALSEAPGKPLRPPSGMRLAAGMDGRSDAAIWTRLPVIDSGVVDDGSRWRQAVWARVKTAGGPVMIISVHTRSPTSQDWNDRRDVFLRSLSRFVARQRPREPIVITGDFNATPQTLAFRRFLSSGVFQQEPNPYAPTWNAKAARYGLGFRIDRTLGANGAKVASWRRLPIGESDHLLSESVIQTPATRR